MAKLRTVPWRVEEFLETPEDIAAYLEAAFEDGDPELIGDALGAVARSRGMTELARRAGMGRQSLYKALSSSGRPEFSTIVKVVRALGLRLTVAPTSQSRRSHRKRTAPRVAKGSAAAKPARKRAAK